MTIREHVTAEQLKSRLDSYIGSFMQSGGSRPLESGGGPPYGDDMEGRISKLEAILPTLATKEDIGSLKIAILEGQSAIRSDIEKSKSEAALAAQSLKADIEKIGLEGTKGLELTKADVLGAVDRAKTENRTWLLGTVLVVITCLIGIATFMSNGLKNQLSALAMSSSPRADPNYKDASQSEPLEKAAPESAANGSEKQN